MGSIKTIQRAEHETENSEQQLIAEPKRPRPRMRRQKAEPSLPSFPEFPPTFQKLVRTPPVHGRAECRTSQHSKGNQPATLGLWTLAPAAGEGKFKIKRHGFDSARGGLFSLQRNKRGRPVLVGRTEESIRTRRISFIYKPVHCLFSVPLRSRRFAHTHSEEVRPRDAMRGAFPGSRPRPC